MARKKLMTNRAFANQKKTSFLSRNLFSRVDCEKKPNIMNTYTTLFRNAARPSLQGRKTRHLMGAVLAVGCGAFLLTSCQSSGAQQNAAPAGVPAAAPTALTTPATAASFGRAMWVWDAGTIYKPDQQAKLFAFSKSKNINVLYVSVGSAFQVGDQAKRNKHQVSHEALAAFMRKAHAEGFKVEVLDGDPSFALKEQHATTLARLQRVLDYNKNAAPEERVDGLQWDTEPYILPEFKASLENRREIYKQYLDSAVEMRDAVKAAVAETPQNFALGYAIPFWMDNEENSVEWGGSTKAASFHLMDILNLLPNSYVAIMAYRDSAPGDNGSIGVSKAEVDYASQNAPNVHVWIGQETLDVKGDPPSITFWQEGEEALETALGQIKEHYKSNPVVGGVAIHHWVSYTALSERPKGEPVERKFEITAPKPGPSGRETLVQGTGSLQPGNTVTVGVKPDGDIWYDQPASPIQPGGSWEVPVRLGNEGTAVGKKFTVRAILKDKQGKVLGQQEIAVTRQ
jgi:hypothetical protein